MPLHYEEKHPGIRAFAGSTLPMNQAIASQDIQRMEAEGFGAPDTSAGRFGSKAHAPAASTPSIMDFQPGTPPTLPQLQRPDVSGLDAALAEFRDTTTMAGRPRWAATGQATADAFLMGMGGDTAQAYFSRQAQQEARRDQNAGAEARLSMAAEQMKIGAQTGYEDRALRHALGGLEAQRGTLGTLNIDGSSFQMTPGAAGNVMATERMREQAQARRIVNETTSDARRQENVLEAIDVRHDRAVELEGLKAELRGDRVSGTDLTASSFATKRAREAVLMRRAREMVRANPGEHGLGGSVGPITNAHIEGAAEGLLLTPTAEENVEILKRAIAELEMTQAAARGGLGGGR